MIQYLKLFKYCFFPQNGLPIQVVNTFVQYYVPNTLCFHYLPRTSIIMVFVTYYWTSGLPVPKVQPDKPVLQSERCHGKCQI